MIANTLGGEINSNLWNQRDGTPTTTKCLPLFGGNCVHRNQAGEQLRCVIMGLNDYDTELNGYRVYLPKQEAVLIGQITDEESEFAGQPAYYMHARGDVVIGKYHSDEETITSAVTVECASRIMADNVHAFDELELDHHLSSVGEALLDAWHLVSESDVLGDQQAHVYVLRDIHECSRGDTATILGIEPSTVDNHLYAARENVESAQQFNDAHDRLTA